MYIEQINGPEDVKKLNIEDRIRDNGTSTKINLKMNYNLINEYVEEIRRESLQLLKENLE